MFGDLNDPNSKVATVRQEQMDHGRGYRIREDLGTEPSVIYLKKVDKEAGEEVAHG
jgi:Fe-S-cluster-containing dehydrogenase component